MMEFYGHFAAAYGTIWLVLLSIAMLTQTHINAGVLGLCGFPVIALLYALIRMAAGTVPDRADEIPALRRRIAYLEGRLAEATKPAPDPYPSPSSPDDPYYGWKL